MSGRSDAELMYPGTYAVTQPDKPAVIMGGSGAVQTYRQLNDRSNRLSRLLHGAGLRPGDSIALVMDNHPRFLEICWAAERSGLYYTPVNVHLNVPEAAYVLKDCGTRTIFTTPERQALATEASAGLTGIQLRLAAGDPAEGWCDYETELSRHPAEPLTDERAGQDMLYSSGTTGRPKAVKLGLTGDPPGRLDPELVAAYSRMLSSDAVALIPGPLHHAGPLLTAIWAHHFGATVVVMERFDPEQALALIERYRVTYSNWVPTMFNRMLKLPQSVRERYDLSSQTFALHDAAPCPVSIKRQIIEWWGPIVYEDYAGTERNGHTLISSEEWLEHEGSVGRPLFGSVHIVDEESGRCLGPGKIGTIYFSGSPWEFEYHNEPEKTAAAYREGGWSTLGDIGYVDEDGYLYLTDRKEFLIISGGVNVYPQEVEEVLVSHDQVMDAAVVGVPDDDLGEAVKAVVELVDNDRKGLDLERELIEHCRSELAHFKCPRSVDFVSELPRLDNGKLYKQEVRDRYWRATAVP